jgi:hypothetical protein
MMGEVMMGDVVMGDVGSKAHYSCSERSVPAASR